ncbi:UNVERIFIED_CONTAM: hypothetical protein HHA_449260 [Hammondia hammondi]|eukprot:XP_008881841.1 hypothetical protein HHA_449260 [Hammondia hammondi]
MANFLKGTGGQQKQDSIGHVRRPRYPTSTSEPNVHPEARQHTHGVDGLQWMAGTGIVLRQDKTVDEMAWHFDPARIL